jgi:hypothetical protein
MLGGFAATPGFLPLDGVTSDTGTSSVSSSFPDPYKFNAQFPAQVVPKAMTFTGASLQATTTTLLTLIDSTLNVNAELYVATPGSTTYTAAPGLICTSSGLTGTESVGTTVFGSCTGSVAVASGDSVVVVVYATATGLSLVSTLPVDVQVGLIGS